MATLKYTTHHFWGLQERRKFTLPWGGFIDRPRTREEVTFLNLHEGQLHHPSTQDNDQEVINNLPWRSEHTQEIGENF